MTKFNQILADFAELTDHLTAFVQSFDEEYTTTIGGDFEALLDDEIIVYAVAVPDAHGISFEKDFVNRFPACADFNLFTLSIMHEIGHLETIDEMIDDTKQREKIQRLASSQADKAYYKLHNEKIATNWAGEYLTAHHDEMKTWEEKTLEILKKTLDKYPD